MANARLGVLLVMTAASFLACAKNDQVCAKPAAAQRRPSACVIDAPEVASADPLKEPSAMSEPAPAPSNESSQQTIDLIREALQADQAGNLEVCIEKEKEALKLDDSPRMRLHLASCESRKGKLVDALKDSEKALERGLVLKDASVMKVARARVLETLNRVPHVTFRAAPNVNLVRVGFDNRPVPLDTLGKKFSVDPGDHVVEVTTEVGGQSQTDTCTMHVAEKTMNPVSFR